MAENTEVEEQTLNISINETEDKKKSDETEDKKKSGKLFGKKSSLRDSKRSKRKQSEVVDEPEEQALKATGQELDKDDTGFIDGTEDEDLLVADRPDSQTNEESPLKPKKKERKSLKGRIKGRLSKRKSKKSKGDQIGDCELDQSKDDTLEDGSREYLDVSKDYLDISKDDIDDEQDVTKEDEVTNDEINVDGIKEEKFMDAVEELKELMKKNKEGEEKGYQVEENSNINNENVEEQDLTEVALEVKTSSEDIGLIAGEVVETSAATIDHKSQDTEEGKDSEKKEINWELVGPIKEDELQESVKLAKIAMGKMVRNVRLTKTYCTCCTVM